MRIALFGPPGAGKGTQAALIGYRFGFRSVSTGELIRTAMRNGSPIGMEAPRYVQDGTLVPDLLVTRLAEAAVEECDFDGFILDGYPRTVGQARSLDAFLDRHDAALDALICLHVSDAELVDRLSARRVHRETGTTYHLVYNPPPPGLSPDLLVQRPDDHPDAIRRRLSEYRSVTEPVMARYGDHLRLVRVDASGTVSEVASLLATVLERLAVRVLA
jgi:adenylate kinase